MVNHDPNSAAPDSAALIEHLRPIPDPEMPISIVDLGLIEAVRFTPRPDGQSDVEIDVLPTFVGCPALDVIRTDIERTASAIEGIADVIVRFIHAPRWTVDRISDAGRASLLDHGVTVPAPAASDDVVPLRISAVPCPFCASSGTQLESTFGPTRCRMVYYCPACKNTFEHLKRVE